MDNVTFGGVIFCSYRSARGCASRALKAAGITATYFSSASLKCGIDPNPTPRYVFHGATAAQVTKLENALVADGAGTEMYTEKE